MEKTLKVNPCLDELWDKYVECEGITTKHVKTVQNYIAQLPTKRLSEAKVICDYLIANCRDNTSMRVVTYFSHCCDWAVENSLISVNPFKVIASGLRRREKDISKIEIETAYSDRKKIRDIHWKQIVDNPYREPFHQSMMTDEGYLVFREVKVIGQSGREQKEWVNVLYDREYAQGWIKELFRKVEPDQLLPLLSEAQQFYIQYLGVNSN